MTPTVWTHLEDARQAIEAAGLVLPNPSALDDQLDRAYAGVVLAWNTLSFETPADLTAEQELMARFDAAGLSVSRPTVHGRPLEAESQKVHLRAGELRRLRRKGWWRR